MNFSHFRPLLSRILTLFDKRFSPFRFGFGESRFFWEVVLGFGGSFLAKFGKNGIKLQIFLPICVFVNQIFVLLLQFKFSLNFDCEKKGFYGL